jgi:hypothetical protein
MSGMSSHRTELLGDFRALGEGAVRVATGSVVSAGSTGLETTLVMTLKQEVFDAMMGIWILAYPVTQSE